jgi:hypothetical protein
MTLNGDVFMNQINIAKFKKFDHRVKWINLTEIVLIFYIIIKWVSCCRRHFTRPL